MLIFVDLLKSDPQDLGNTFILYWVGEIFHTLDRSSEVSHENI